MKTIKVKHTSIVIPEYKLGDKNELERALSIWDQVYYKLEPKGYKYREDTQELLIPRGISIGYLEKLFNCPCDIIYEHDPYQAAVYKLKTEPRDDTQRRGISFLIGEGDFKYTKKYSQLALNFNTGLGKTYTAITALTILKLKSIIITHADKIKYQWLKEFEDKTYINKEFIYDIKGSDAIDRLLKNKNLKYKVYLVNHRTIYSYAKSNGWDKVTELFKHLQVGIKIFDEAHLEFENMINIDLYTNTMKTFYLTANFERSEQQENKLFDTCFKNVIKYGIEENITQDKYIKYLAVLFNTRPRIDEEMWVKGLFGFDKNRYIGYQMEKGILFNVILTIVRKMLGVGGKQLIMLSTIDATKKVYEFIKDQELGVKVALYNSTIDKDSKESALEADIIISTPKSLGTGADIKGLRFVINTEQYGSKITANQVSGRLRTLPDNENCGYIELIDFGFKTVVNLYKRRLKYLKSKCLEAKEYNYKGDD
jgi:superfamily II DNA or RNA helicase